MKRVLVVRLLALEIAPMVGALALSAYSQRLMPLWFSAAALVIFTSVTLSIRDGAVLENWGTVCERKKDGGWFWAWIAMHISFGVFLLAGAVVMLLRP